MKSPALDLYTAAAERAANQVISTYSTSFGAATRVLGTRHRQHIRNIYALVRVADELVDGVAHDAGMARADQESALDRFVDETNRALGCGFSTDLIIHAFARTARRCGIGQGQTDPFFDSMRTDLLHSFEPGRARFDDDTHDIYVHGSAEVVGLMCLKVFIRDDAVSPQQLARLEHGARRLGAAFQDVNFLRDLADDTTRLRRSYLGRGGRLTPEQRDAYVTRIREQLADAEAVVPLLPRDARAAVRCAAALFSGLANRIAATDVDDLYRMRVRVPDLAKTALLSRAVARTWTERTS